MPVIGAINGPAIGAGVQLAMICDLRVVAPEAYFQFPIAKYGLALDNWSIRRLTSLVGYGRARGMLLAAERLDRRVGAADRDGQPDRHAGRRAGLGRRDRRAWRRWRCSTPSGCSTTTAPTRSRGRAHKELFDRAWSQPGRHRGAGGAHREAAAEVPGRLMMLRAALRFGGRDGLAGGRRVGAAGAAGRAGGAGRRARRDRGRSPTRSPNYRDGVFVNLEPGLADQTGSRRSASCCAISPAGRLGQPAARDPSRWPSRRRSIGTAPAGGQLVRPLDAR